MLKRRHRKADVPQATSESWAWVHKVASRPRQAQKRQQGCAEWHMRHEKTQTKLVKNTRRASRELDTLNPVAQANCQTLLSPCIAILPTPMPAQMPVLQLQPRGMLATECSKPMALPGKLRSYALGSFERRDVCHYSIAPELKPPMWILLYKAVKQCPKRPSTQGFRAQRFYGGWMRLAAFKGEFEFKAYKSNSPHRNCSVHI